MVNSVAKLAHSFLYKQNIYTDSGPVSPMQWLYPDHAMVKLGPNFLSSYYTDRQNIENINGKYGFIAFRLEANASFLSLMKENLEDILTKYPAYNLNKDIEEVVSRFPEIDYETLRIVDPFQSGLSFDQAVKNLNFSFAFSGHNNQQAKSFLYETLNITNQLSFSSLQDCNPDSCLTQSLLNEMEGISRQNSLQPISSSPLEIKKGVNKNQSPTTVLFSKAKDRLNDLSLYTIEGRDYLAGRYNAIEDNFKAIINTLNEIEQQAPFPLVFKFNVKDLPF